MSSHISEPSSPSSIPSPVSGPSRKRPRSEMSSEERKEARAHRNRIAAQNSRDRRKAQFTYLERRVAELEEENKRLRAGLPPSEPQQDSVKDRENQELRARIASLERGLEAVVKAFSGQEAAPVIPTAEASKLPESSPASTTTSISAVSTSTSTPSCPPTDSTQSTVPSQTMSFPLSPTPSHNSDTPEFTFTSTTSPVSSPLPLPTSESELESQSTRHLARMATTRPRVALQRVNLNSNSTPLTTITTQPFSLLKSPSLSTMQQWKRSSVRSSANLAQPLPHQRRGQRVYQLLICSTLPDKLKGRRRRRRPVPRR